jgi:choline dehydrogenase-like flavoprotein
VAELLVSPLLGDPPMVEDHDLVDLVQPVGLVGYEQDRTAPTPGPGTGRESTQEMVMTPANQAAMVNLMTGNYDVIIIGSGAHQAGTCRFGTDPATSVLDVNCKAHELDNLYVVDTNFFPSIGAVNPALTAMANALRVGDHMQNRMA